MGTPFSDGRLDLAFKDLAYEREQVPMLPSYHPCYLVITPLSQVLRLQKELRIHVT